MRPWKALSACRRMVLLGWVILCPGIGFVSQRAHAAGMDDLRKLMELSNTPELSSRREICRKILAEKPGPLAGYFCTGYEALLQGREAESEEALNLVLKEQPGFDLAMVLYGEAYADLGRPDKAEALFRRAIEAQPARSDARYALGALLLKQGAVDPKYYPQALEAFRQLTELNPDSPDGWSNLGLTLARMGRLEDAEQMYKKAIARDPKDPLLHDCLASVYVRQERSADAEAAWKDALVINPGYGPAVVELASLYARTDRVMEAIGILESGRQAISVPPWGPRIRRILGFAFLGLQEPQSAKARFLDAAALGGDPLSFLGLGHVLLLEGDTQGGLTAIERGAELDSSLALPFVQAWKEALGPVVRPEEEPSVYALITRLSQNSGTSEAAGELHGATGANATMPLVGFVLEGWTFDQARLAMKKLGSAPRDTTQASYDTPPVPLQKVQADFPESAQEEGMTGLVQVIVTVGTDGRVSQARIQSCTTPPILCETALKAAKRWTFAPATRFGSPVQASIMLPFRFSKGVE